MEEFLLAHGTGVTHVHEAPHKEGEEAAAQEAPAAPEAVCSPELPCTLLTLLGGPLSSLRWFCRAGLRATLCLLFPDSSGGASLSGHLPSRQALPIPIPILCLGGRGPSSPSAVWGLPLFKVLSVTLALSTCTSVPPLPTTYPNIKRPPHSSQERMPGTGVVTVTTCFPQ